MPYTGLLVAIAGEVVYVIQCFLVHLCCLDQEVLLIPQLQQAPLALKVSKKLLYLVSQSFVACVARTMKLVLNSLSRFYGKTSYLPLTLCSSRKVLRAILKRILHPLFWSFANGFFRVSLQFEYISLIAKVKRTIQKTKYRLWKTSGVNLS